MPRRRRLAAGLGAGLSDAATMLLQNRFIEGRQKQLRELIAEQQDKQSETEMLKSLLTTFGPRIAEGGMDPEQMPASVQPYLPQGPSARRRLLDVGKEYDARPAEIPENIPSFVRAESSRRGVEPDVAMQGPFLDEGGKLTGQPQVQRPELDSLIASLEARRTEGRRQLPREAVSSMVGGVGQAEYLTEEEQGQRGPVRTERTAEEQAARESTIERARGQAQQDVTNDPRNVKGFASREEAAAYARQRGQLSADRQAGAGSFAPQYDIQEEAGPDGNLVYRVIEKRSGTSRELPGGPAAEPLTDAMRQSFGYAERATASHNIMMRLEPMLVQRSLPVAWASINAPESVTDPATRQYLQAVRENINAQARRESGAAISEIELERYIRTMGWKPGDDPGTLKQKQVSRRRVVGGLGLQSGTRLGQMFTSIEELQQLPSAQGRDMADVIREAEASGYRVIR